MPPFDPLSGRELWRARHTTPGRGVFRTVAAIAARAASLYFRCGAPAMTAVRGVQMARTVTSLSWSGLATRSSVSNLQALANASTRSYDPSRFRQFGIASRVGGGRGGSFTRNRINGVEDRLLDRIDPALQLERLSRFLWHRERLATLRGQWMYFYTDLDRGGNGLAGVNINNGRTDREGRVSDLDG